MYRKNLSFILKLILLMIVGSAIVGCGNIPKVNSSTQPTPPQRAEVAAVTEWLEELNKMQTSRLPNGVTVTLTMKTISHPMTAEDLVRGLVPADANLIDVTFTYYNSHPGLSIHNAAGEAEAEGIGVTVSDTQNLSEADVANGITFKGSIEIKFVSRYRTQSSAPYTAWADDSRRYDVTIQNGTPTVQGGDITMFPPMNAIETVIGCETLGYSCSS